MLPNSAEKPVMVEHKEIKTAEKVPVFNPSLFWFDT
jgi:hypothetical protein